MSPLQPSGLAMKKTTDGPHAAVAAKSRTHKESQVQLNRKTQAYDLAPRRMVLIIG